ncbi:MAG: hypothetical protein MRY32_01740 [Rickettsiales bacterium]|nr:hypothetical protein [Rickettsiales bacterium]
MQLGVESSYRQKVDEADEHRTKLHHQLQSSLKQMEEFASAELKRLGKEIELSDRSDEALRLLLMGQINKGRGLVRFAWVNADDLMTISSVTGIRDPPSDLSQREYIKQTRAQPGAIVTSKMLTHIVNQRQVILMAIGLADDKGYIGTLNAALNLPPMRDHIDTIMTSCNCHYSVYSPHGEWITGDDDEMRLPRGSSHGFAVVSAISAATQAMLRDERLYLRIIAALIAALLSVGLWIVLTIWYQRDARMALKLQAQLHRAQKLHESWLQSTTGELHEAASSIMSYGQTIQAQVEEGALNADIPYWYDDVQEMGRNLQTLTESMNQLSDESDERLIPFTNLISATLAPFEDGIERRNMLVQWDSAQWQELHVAASSWSALLKLNWAWMIRHAQDESAIHIDVEQSEDRLHISIRLSKLRQALLSTHQQDLSGLISSFQHDMTQAWDEKLRAHVNFLMMKQLARSRQMRFRMEVGPDQSLTLTLMQRV